MPECGSDAVRLLTAVHFAAIKHAGQRRKDAAASPYINHPVAVAAVLATVGQVTDPTTLMGAVLHDTIEDTSTAPHELEEAFGSGVRHLVEELTDDKHLPKAERKRRQIMHAPTLSRPAKLIKISDKVCNVVDVIHTPPTPWSLDRRRDYLDWSAAVVAGCHGCHPALERHYITILRHGRAVLTSETDDYCVVCPRCVTDDAQRPGERDAQG